MTASPAGTAAAPEQVKPKITVRRLAGRRMRVTATRGAVTTEAVFTMAEVQELYRKLGEYLGAPALRDAQDGAEGGGHGG